ncbi:MAG TPA: type II toxin-antitoxin system RelE/ParE family toxin [Allosphingosinicella sp.]
MRLYLSARAEADFQRIYRFNLERSLDWADRVERRLLARVDALTTTPSAGRPHRPAGVRRVSVADIQYVIDYRVTPDAIEILRVQSSREIL